jgi:hypothetical protein
MMMLPVGSLCSMLLFSGVARFIVATPRIRELRLKISELDARMMRFKQELDAL